MKVIMQRKKIPTIIIKSLLRLHTFLGKVIDVLAIKANGGLHPKHHLMRYYEFFLENIHSGDTVLDIGCGNGFVATQIAKKAKLVTGIDTDRHNIALARKRSATNTEFFLGDATIYRFRQHYNVVVLSNVLEHIQNRVPFLQKIQPLAKTFLIRVPMVDRDWLPLYRKKLGMFYFCDSTHFTEYTFESFRQEMAEAKLEITSHTIRFGEIWAVVKKI